MAFILDLFPSISLFYLPQFYLNDTNTGDNNSIRLFQVLVLVKQRKTHKFSYFFPCFMMGFLAIQQQQRQKKS